MTTRAQIEHFWMLANAGKSAALDINTITGEMAVRCTRSAEGVEGKGAPPACYTDDWARVVICINGKVTRGSER